MAKFKWDELFGWHIVENAWSLSSQKRFSLFCSGFILFIPLCLGLKSLLPDFKIVEILIEVYMFVTAFFLGRSYLKSFDINLESFYGFALNKDSLIGFFGACASLLIIKSTLDFLLAGFDPGLFKFFIIGPLIFLISLFFSCWIILTLLLVIEDKGKNLKKNIQKSGRVISLSLIHI